MVKYIIRKKQNKRNNNKWFIVETNQIAWEKNVIMYKNTIEVNKINAYVILKF